MIATHWLANYAGIRLMHHEIGPRITAARHLVGLRNVGDLATKLAAQGNTRGLGTTNLRGMERGELTPTFPQLNEIAYACDVPVEWFTADFNRLPEISEKPREVLARLLAEAQARAAERRAGKPSSTRPLHEAGQ